VFDSIIFDSMVFESNLLNIIDGSNVHMNLKEYNLILLVLLEYR